MNLARRTAEVLEQHGWHHGGFLCDTNGAMCVEGALNFAKCGNPKIYCQDDTDWQIAFDLLVSISAEQFPERMVEDDGMLFPSTLNNHPNTKLDDIFLVLDKAAVRIDELV